MPTNILNLILKGLRKKSNHLKGPKTFNQQIEELLARGYSGAAGLSRDEFLNRFAPLRKIFQPGDLIVVGKQLVSLPMQMAMTELNGKTGYTYLDLNSLANIEETGIATLPYLIRDPENGSALKNCSLDYCLEQFAKQKRSGLTAEEGIALITHEPEMMENCKINLLGSRCGSSYVVCLQIIDSRPALGYNWLDGIDLEPGWANPSCGSRISA